MERPCLTSPLAGSMHLCLRLHWSAILFFATARAFASSLLGLPLSGTSNVDGDAPAISDVLADSTKLPPLATACREQPLDFWGRGLSPCMDSRAPSIWALALGLRELGAKRSGEKKHEKTKSSVFKVVAAKAALTPCVYGRETCPMDTRLRGLGRCGHHAFADGRSARRCHASSDVFCRFCAIGRDTLEHAFLDCPTHSQSRECGYFSTLGLVLLALHKLLSTDPHVNRTQYIFLGLFHLHDEAQSPATIPPTGQELRRQGFSAVFGSRAQGAASARRLGRIPTHIAFAGKRRLKEERSKNALRGNCQQSGPTRNPTLTAQLATALPAR